MISFNLGESIAILAVCIGCLADTEYRETGSDNCLSLSQRTVPPTFIKKDGKVICYKTADTFYKSSNSWRSTDDFTCSQVAKRVSVCFDNFTQNDVGNFSSYDSSANNAMAVHNIDLRQTVLVTSVELNPVHISVNAGQQINITCQTTSCIPPANITWNMPYRNFTSYASNTKDRNSSLEKTESFLLSTVYKEDNGKTVYCEANNTLDKKVSSERRKIEVLFKPEVSTIPKSPYKVAEGNTTVLKCSVNDANPKTIISWKWFKTESTDSVLHSEQVYILNDTRKEQKGSYSCTATNSVGESDAAKIIINVLYVPEVTSSSDSPLVVIEGNTATLTCTVKDANPNVNISWKWIKPTSSDTDVLNGSTFVIKNIQRRRSGSYNCTATNSVGTSAVATICVEVHYKPDVMIKQENPYRRAEGQNVSLECSIRDAKPATITEWKWIKTDTPGKVFNGPTYILNNIERKDTGSYSCTASNSVGRSKVATIYIDVLYKPIVEKKTATIVNEHEKAVLTREIDSNPFANISWYNGTEVIKYDNYVNSTSITIDMALCTDTKNYTLVASNSVEGEVTSLVELIVNCKPRADSTNITLGVTDTTGIDFATTIIAYPHPAYRLTYENGTKNSRVMDSLIVNAVYNFTIHFKQTAVNNDDYGVYHLLINNTFGSLIVYVNVIPQRIPDSPRISNVDCDVTSARVQWLSSFNGGDIQQFTVFAYIGEEKTSRSEPVDDAGENKMHKTSIHLLKPSTVYYFDVFAKNKHGNSSSEIMSCKTLAEDVPGNLPIIAGSAAAGGITLAVIVIVTVAFLRRFKRHEKQIGRSKRFSNDECTNEDTDDGLKDNILYVSAGPRNDNESERAVYAAVTKKPLEDNANVYADVKKDGKEAKAEAAIYSDVKPKKGLFKKDGKQKQKNGKKQRGKQVAADVYENSEDIAMTSNADNVYSNTSYNAKNDQEQRGYKNKDGLLYVDVQFDAKKGNENPVIHGEDEKTDYATVEFPMPSFSQEDASAEK